METDIGIKKPKLYPLNSLEAVKDSASKLVSDEEGYVVVDKNYHRIKVKSPTYLKMSYLKNNNRLTRARVLEIIKENEEEEFLSYFPEYKQVFKVVKSDYYKFVARQKEIEKRVLELKKKYPNIKNFACKIGRAQNDYKTLAFMLYKGQVKNYKEYIESLSIRQLSDKIERYVNKKRGDKNA